MKKILGKKVLALVVFIALSSCTSNTIIEPAGLCSDPITLSDNDIVFSVAENTTTVTAVVPFSWVNHIEFEEKDYYYDNEILSSSEFVIEEDAFTIERNDQTLEVKINKNDSGVERQLIVGLQSGNCFDALKITQVAN